MLMLKLELLFCIKRLRAKSCADLPDKTDLPHKTELKVQLFMANVKHKFIPLKKNLQLSKTQQIF